MGRVVRGGQQGARHTYVPKAFGNREDPAPFSVVVRIPTEGEKREIAIRKMQLEPPRTVAIDVTNEKGEREQIMVASDADAYGALIPLQKEVVERFVEKLEGVYEVRGKPIKTGAEIAAFGETELIAELALEVHTLMSLPDEGDGGKKALPAPSSSSPPDTSVTPTAVTTPP